MRFEHDNYDIDVYSLCESVYYSCNNDEYDYVLECVNNWIYNNYNDNILLNELTKEGILRMLGNKYKLINPGTDNVEVDYTDREERDKFNKEEDEEVDKKRMKNMTDEQKQNYALFQHSRSRVRQNAEDLHTGIVGSILARNEINRIKREERRKDPHQLILDPYSSMFMSKRNYEDNLKYLRDTVQNIKKSSPKELKDGVLPSFYRDMTPDLPDREAKRRARREKRKKEREKATSEFLSKYGEAKRLGIAFKKYRDAQAAQNTQAFSAAYEQAKKKAQQSKSDNPLEDKKGQPAEVKPNTPPQQPGVFTDRKGRNVVKFKGRMKGNKVPKVPPQQSPSPTPLEDNKGKPAEVKPNTPPQQPGVFTDRKGRNVVKSPGGRTGHKVPKPKLPVPIPQPKPQSNESNNNNNNNNKSGLKTWHKAAIGVGAAAAVGAGIYAYKQYKNRPKSVIGKRIAALRSIYRKFMLNAQHNPQKAGIFKRIAAKILSVIDKLMGYLQNAAG